MAQYYEARWHRCFVEWTQPAATFETEATHETAGDTRYGVQVRACDEWAVCGPWEEAFGCLKNRKLKFGKDCEPCIRLELY